MPKELFSISEERAVYQRDDHTLFTREDIYVKLTVTFRDEMLEKLKGPKLSVFLCIALHCNRDMESWPSISQIEKETGYSNKPIGEAIDELCELGLITKVKSRNKGSFDNNQYTVRQFFYMGRDSERPETENPDHVYSVHMEQVHTKKIPSLKNLEISDEISPRKQAGNEPLAGGLSYEITIPDWKSIRHELAEEFTSKTNIKLPPIISQRDYKSRETLWWAPLKKLYLLCEQDIERTKQLIGDTVDELNRTNMKFSDPNSLVRTSNWLASKDTGQSQGAWRQG